MKQYAVLDIGGTGIKSGIADAAGHLAQCSSTETPTDTGKEEFMAFLYGQLAPLVDGCSGIGISVLGTWDAQAGSISGACDNLPVLQGLALEKLLQARFGLPVAVSNDVKAAAAGEARWGAGKKLERFFCMTLGTGIGGAMVENGSVWRGQNGQAGEIGYLFRAGGRRYEQLASTRALLRQLRTLPAAQAMDEDAALIGQALRGRFGQAIVSAWMTEVARGICEVIFLLDPGTVVIGGGISAQGPLLIQPLQREVERLLAPDFRGKTRLCAAALANRASLLGAAVPLDS